MKEAGLIPEDEARLCIIADGARWIWKAVKELYPDAVEVLDIDYYHLVSIFISLPTIFMRIK
jgi:hypothetical protein